MKTEVGVLNNIDVTILHYLLTTEGLHNTSDIAKKAKISWNTANAHLKDLHKRSYLKQIKKGKVILWKISMTKKQILA